VSTLWLVVGLVVICLAVFTYWKPMVLYWISDQTNGREAKKWAERGRPEYLDAYTKNRNGIRFVIPLAMLVIGLGMVGYAFQE